MTSYKIFWSLSLLTIMLASDAGADQFHYGLPGYPGEAGPHGRPGLNSGPCHESGRKRRHDREQPDIEDPLNHPIGPSPVIDTQLKRPSRQLNVICAPGCYRGPPGPPGPEGQPGERGIQGIRRSRAKRTQVDRIQKNLAVKRHVGNNPCQIEACRGKRGPPGPAGVAGFPANCW